MAFKFLLYVAISANNGIIKNDLIVQMYTYICITTVKGAPWDETFSMLSILKI